MKVVPLAEIKQILSKLSKERELNREQKIALEHSEKIVKLGVKKTRELMKRLMEEVDKINEKQACKLADLLPKDKEEVLAIFAKETFVPKDDEIKKILEIIGEYI